MSGMAGIIGAMAGIMDWAVWWSEQALEWALLVAMAEILGMVSGIIGLAAEAGELGVWFVVAAGVGLAMVVAFGACLVEREVWEEEEEVVEEAWCRC